MKKEIWNIDKIESLLAKYGFYIYSIDLLNENIFINFNKGGKDCGSVVIDLDNNAKIQTKGKFYKNELSLLESEINQKSFYNQILRKRKNTFIEVF